MHFNILFIVDTSGWRSRQRSRSKYEAENSRKKQKLQDIGPTGIKIVDWTELVAMWTALEKSRSLRLPEGETVGDWDNVTGKPHG